MQIIIKIVLAYKSIITYIHGMKNIRITKQMDKTLLVISTFFILLYVAISFIELMETKYNCINDKPNYDVYYDIYNNIDKDLYIK